MLYPLVVPTYDPHTQPCSALYMVRYIVELGGGIFTSKVKIFAAEILQTGGEIGSSFISNWKTTQSKDKNL